MSFGGIEASMTRLGSAEATWPLATRSAAITSASASGIGSAKVMPWKSSARSGSTDVAESGRHARLFDHRVGQFAPGNGRTISPTASCGAVVTSIGVRICRFVPGSTGGPVPGSVASVGPSGRSPARAEGSTRPSSAAAADALATNSPDAISAATASIGRHTFA